MDRSAVSGTRPEPVARPAPAEPPAAVRSWPCLLAEAYRLRLLRALEQRLADCGYARIAGVDEAGRGSLAGPVVAAAVILDARRLIPGVDDSKALTAEERERIAAAIRASAVAVAVIGESAEVIDHINILEATRRAMSRALAALCPAPDCALVDAVAVNGLDFPCLPVIRGDAISYAVACASIVAKVERDRMMCELDRRYPHYGFAEHKGYGVPEHLQALASYGPSPVHRLTYRPVVPRHGDDRGAAVSDR